MYVQWMIDRILQQQRLYIKVYVNDIVIFFNTLKEHLKHLYNVFNILDKMKICLLLKKFYLMYSFIQLLSQWINALNFTTLKDKLVTIFRIRFSLSLSQLEKYLDLTDYLQQYILHYAAIVKSLQQQKTFLNQGLWAKEMKENAKK